MFYQQRGLIVSSLFLGYLKSSFKGWLELQRMTWSKLPRRIKERGGWRGEIHAVFCLFFSSACVWSPPVNSQYFKRDLMGWEVCRTLPCPFQSINWASWNLPIWISLNIQLVKLVKPIKVRGNCSCFVFLRAPKIILKKHEIKTLWKKHQLIFCNLVLLFPS